MIQELTPLGVNVPSGFAVCSSAYDALLDQANLRGRLENLLRGLDGEMGSRALLRLQGY